MKRQLYGYIKKKHWTEFRSDIGLADILSKVRQIRYTILYLTLAGENNILYFLLTEM